MRISLNFSWFTIGWSKSTITEHIWWSTKYECDRPFELSVNLIEFVTIGHAFVHRQTTSTICRLHYLLELTILFSFLLVFLILSNNIVDLSITSVIHWIEHFVTLFHLTIRVGHYNKRKSLAPFDVLPTCLATIDFYGLFAFLLLFSYFSNICIFMLTHS